MDWLKAIAPTLAAALGGPLAGLAVEAVAKAMDLPFDDTKRIIETGKLSADQIAQIQLAELELKKQEKAMGLNFEQLAVEDRKSAREMQINTHSRLVPALAVIIVSAFIVVVVGTLLGYSKIEGAMAGTLVGYLSAKAEQVVTFFFGSSSGSQNKDIMLYNSSPK